MPASEPNSQVIRPGAWQRTRYSYTRSLPFTFTFTLVFAFYLCVVIKRIQHHHHRDDASRRRNLMCATCCIDLAGRQTASKLQLDPISCLSHGCLCVCVGGCVLAVCVQKSVSVFVVLLAETKASCLRPWKLLVIVCCPLSRSFLSASFSLPPSTLSFLLFLCVCSFACLPIFSLDFDLLFSFLVFRFYFISSICSARFVYLTLAKGK